MADEPAPTAVDDTEALLPADSGDAHAELLRGRAEAQRLKIGLIDKRASEHEALLDRIAAKKAASRTKALEKLEAEGATAAAEALAVAQKLEEEDATAQREEIREQNAMEHEQAEAEAAKAAGAEDRYAEQMSTEAGKDAAEQERLIAAWQEEQTALKTEMSERQAAKKAALQAKLEERRAAAKAKKEAMLAEATPEAAAAADGFIMMVNPIVADTTVEDSLTSALLAAGASPEAAAEIASEHVSTERSKLYEWHEIDERIEAEISAVMKRADATFAAAMKGLSAMKGMSRDQEGRGKIQTTYASTGRWERLQKLSIWAAFLQMHALYVRVSSYEACSCW
jgi:hypothetical protein